MAKQKAVIFIDGSNTYFAQKKSGFWLDWVKVKRYFEQIYRVLEYRYYVGLRENDQGIKSFLHKLKKIGFHLITKPVKIIVNEKGERVEKANFDVEMTADILLYRQNFDIWILFSGDSDFAYLNRILKQMGKSMAVYSTRRTLAWELKLNTRYYFFDEIKELTKHRRFAKL